MKQRASLAILFPVVVLALVVLAYGYWFERTHGALYVTANDVSDRQHVRTAMPIELTMRDDGGRELARAAGNPPDGTIYVVAPAEYACHGVETRAPFSTAAQDEWRQCFAKQSRWVATWAPSVRSADVRWDRCSLQRLPVQVSASGDTWWLWWVPLPHIGGKPYTFFSIAIELDRSRCQETR